MRLTIEEKEFCKYLLSVSPISKKEMLNKINHQWREILNSMIIQSKIMDKATLEISEKANESLFS